jgi:hypothetical protein
MDPINRYIIQSFKSQQVMTVLNQNLTLTIYVTDVSVFFRNLIRLEQRWVERGA